jgi:large subunit ribosomal protein L6
MTAEAQTPAAPMVKQSRIGKRPIPVPKGVTINVSGGRIEVQGPKGRLSQQLPEQTGVKRAGDVLTVYCSAPGRAGPRLQGLARALVANMVVGVAEGFTKTLELVGTGYRAEVKGRTITLQVGLSHPAVCEMPESVTASVPPDSKGSVLILTSPDRAALGQLTATLRGKRPPEPYGGKGVRLRGETLRRKAGKAGKKAAGS